MTADSCVTVHGLVLSTSSPSLEDPESLVKYKYDSMTWRTLL